MTIDSFEPCDAPTILCDQCGEPTERVWLAKGANVIGDEMDHVQINGTKTPIHFRSKELRRKWLKANGLREKDASGVGSVSAYGLEQAKVLLERVDKERSGWRDPDKAPIGITSNDGIIRYLKDRNRAENRGEFGFSDR